MKKALNFQLLIEIFTDFRNFFNAKNNKSAQLMYVRVPVRNQKIR
ncbi:MAG: hypothetical protein ABI203_09745 [Mucilaginibacter sp.]